MSSTTRRRTRMTPILLTVAIVTALLSALATPASAATSPVLHVESEATHLCARVPYASTTARTQLDQDSCTDKTNREWQWEPQYGSPQQLVNVHSHQCLTYLGDGHDGTAVQYPCSSDNQHQLWYRTTLYGDWSDQWTLYRNVASGRCLAPANDSTAVYTPLVVTGCSYTDIHQRWAAATTPLS